MNWPSNRSRLASLRLPVALTNRNPRRIHWALTETVAECFVQAHTPSKSDVDDAQWLQRLHACGLLRARFHPGRDIEKQRSYLRARKKQTDYVTAHIQHMQKALTFMNIQLHHVIATITGITGITGMRIIRAVVDGERDPDKLVAMCDVRCKESHETIPGDLVENYHPERACALMQALALYGFYRQCIDVPQNISLRG